MYNNFASNQRCVALLGPKKCKRDESRKNQSEQVFLQAVDLLLSNRSRDLQACETRLRGTAYNKSISRGEDFQNGFQEPPILADLRLKRPTRFFKQVFQEQPEHVQLFRKPSVTS